MMTAIRCNLLVAAVVSVAAGLWATSASAQIISRSEAERHGLARAWFTQIDLDRSRHRVTHIVQAEGLLLVQTDGSILHVLDAETGQTMWSAQVGNPQYPSLAPAANEKVVAVVNGSTLYTLDLVEGELIAKRMLSGGPGAGPALTKTQAYVPMATGKLDAYRLKDITKPAWYYASTGRAMIQPVASKRSICWPTDQGYLYVGDAEDPRVRYRVETSQEITAPPAYGNPYFYAASLDGYVYAVHELSGNQRWRFSAGDPISVEPAVIKDNLYVCADRSGMFCVDVETGVEKWWAPRAARFLAATPDRVFATDRIGTMLILDAKSGARLGSIFSEAFSIPVANQQTDRIYLASDTGLIQCLRDAALTEPLEYRPQEGEEEPIAEAEQKGLEPAAKPAAPVRPAERAADPADPFGGDVAPADDEPANPFGGGDDAPADDPFGVGGDNPFGD